MTNVTIHTSFNLAEAQLIRSRLEAAGFQAFLADEASALWTGGYVMAVGGIRIQVPDTEAKEAHDFLASPDQ